MMILDEIKKNMLSEKIDAYEQLAASYDELHRRVNHRRSSSMSVIVVSFSSCSYV
jgi:hypothetical protein